jgi:hypothetical protein
MPTLQEKNAYQDKLRSEGVVEGSPEWNEKVSAFSQSGGQEKTAEQRQQEKEQYQTELRSQGLTEGSPEWNQKMNEYDAKAGEEKDPLEGRERKPSEINQPTPEHARDQEEVASKLKETDKEITGNLRTARKDRNKAEQELHEAQIVIQKQEEVAKKKSEVTGWQQRIADGNTTQAEMAELKVHPEHTSVSSGHGNPAD